MEPSVDQKLLEDFLSLCRHKSFSHAAEERNVTQPAFSRRIRALEEWLGVVLFDRTALPIRLTAQGEEFLPLARDLAERMADAKRAFSDRSRANVVRIISLPTLSINVLPDLLIRAKERAGGLTFAVNPFPQSVEEHFCALMDNQVDMLLTYKLDEYESDSAFRSHIDSATVATERFLPVVGGALAERLDPAPASLPYLSYSNFSFANRIILPLYEKTPCELEVIYESSLSEGIVKMLEKGLGMAWVPESLVCEQLRRGTLRRIWEDRPDLRVDVDIKLYRNRGARREALDRFWEAVR